MATMNDGRPVASAISTSRPLASPSGEAVSWLKKRSRNRRTRCEIWLRSGARTGPSAACSFSESASGPDKVRSLWNASAMGDLHHLHDFLRRGARVLLLHQLREYAF